MSPLIKHFHSFNESPLPEIIGLDTSFVIKVLVKGQEYYKKCCSFLSRLKTKQPIIVFSQILRPELWQAHFKIVLQKQLNKKEVNVAEEVKKDPSLRRDFCAESTRINSLFNDLLGNFEYWISLPITDEIAGHALVLMNTHNLPSYDAIHVASMLYNDIYPIRNFIVFDRHVEDITSLAVWTHNGIARYKKRHRIRR